jgi:Acyl-CoA synthetases (AMP-forming)/AMP-acid ligases II
MALAAHGAVSEAAAILAPDGDSLLAFATLIPGASADSAELMAHLGRHLPRYALPARIELRPAFAKTTTGKINRKALLEDIQ